MIQSDTHVQIYVHNVMERFPGTVAETDTVQEAVQEMIQRHASALPVTDENGVLKGIVSVNDVLRMIQSSEQLLDCEDFEEDSPTTVASVLCELLLSSDVSEVMTKALHTVYQDDTLEDAAKLMLQHQVHHLPVVSREGELLGIVSTVHFVRLAADRK